MKPVWASDTEMSSELALELIRGQFPELAAKRAELLGVGWDNSAYLIDGGALFRFPRRNMAASLLANETRILPLISPHLPVETPLPQWVGSPASGYPYPFAGYVPVAGQTACSVNWTDVNRARVASRLGKFLKALHSIEISAETAAWAPGDAIRRTDLQMRLGQLKERLITLKPRLAQLGLDAEVVSEAAADLAETPASAASPCWVHGDLYARHLITSAVPGGQFELSGIIDWGDVHLGDAALDLSIAFSFLPPPARPLFLEAYGAGNADGAAWRRARFRAIHYGAILMLYGADVGDTALDAVGKYALRNAMLER